MAEPETFEEDLFADLYADDEPSKPTAPSEQRTTSAPLTTAPPAATDIQNEQEAGNDEYADTNMNDEEEDDDDEVDFNLGNGTVTHHSEAPVSHAFISAAPVQAPTTKGPNSKEDG